MKSTFTHLSSSAAPQKVDERAGKYLSFKLGKEEFAVQVLRVREIMGVQQITPVAQTASYIKGVMNLRGRAIPVIDLKMKFGMPDAEHTSRTSIIVVQMESEGGRIAAGMLVDAVSEVLTLKAGEIENSLPAGSEAITPYLLGTVKIKGKVRILLETNLILTPHEIHKLEEVLA